MSRRQWLPEIIDEIVALEDEGGDIDADKLIERARNPQSVLHDVVDWKWNDDKGAAHEYRRELARGLIRSLPATTTTPGSQNILAPRYVRDVRLPPHEPGYVSLESIEKGSEIARATMLNQLALAISCLRRAVAVSEVLGLRSAVVAALDAAEAVAEQVRTMPMQPTPTRHAGKRFGRGKGATTD